MLWIFLGGVSGWSLLQRPSPFIDLKVADQRLLRSDWTEIRLDKLLEPVGIIRGSISLWSHRLSWIFCGPVEF